MRAENVKFANEKMTKKNISHSPIQYTRKQCLQVFICSHDALRAQYVFVLLCVLIM